MRSPILGRLLLRMEKSTGNPMEYLTLVCKSRISCSALVNSQSRRLPRPQEETQKYEYRKINLIMNTTTEISMTAIPAVIMCCLSIFVRSNMTVNEGYAR